MNLIGNAIKFTEKGSVGIHLRFEQKQAAKLLHIDVIDSGIGLTPEEIGRLFQSFTQADESTTRRFGGTGLGLTISRRLALLLGGDIEVKSERGVGSRFTVSINCGSAADAEIIMDLTESELPTAIVPLNESETLLRGHVLLAEDGRDNQRLLTTHLTTAGARVDVAENGRIAVEMALTQPYDLILMDMQMPEMDGYTATAELRRRGFTVPIVALTAHAMAEDRTKCMASGCTYYLSKPVNQETLLKVVSRFLSHCSPSDEFSSETPKASPAPAAYATEGTIHSTMSEYPGMKKIIKEFVEGLPDEIMQMRQFLEKDDLLSLRRAAHRLRGTGGGYGFDAITQLSGDVEDAINAADNRKSINQKINLLFDLIRRCEGFDESRAMAPATGGVL